MEKCDCSEGFIVLNRKVRIRTGVPHDCDYISQRNKLIPLAVAEADREVPFSQRRSREGNAKWSDAFFGHMDRLWRRAVTAGLIIEAFKRRASETA